jgi:Glu-tRNA(Gln) amidotransferase subunit E-like FAD-binding protein
MCLAFICMPLAQADTVTINKSIPFAEDSGATDELKEECEFQTRLPEYLKKEAKRSVDVVLSKDPLEDAEGKTLSLEITNMYGLGGGAYSGSKSAVVSGELKENGEVIASMSARRHSIMGMMPGTCSIMKRIAKKMGEDIAEWLKEPTMDAKLGDLEDDDEEAEEAEETG